MVFNVARAQFNLLLAFELVEQVARVLAKGVDQNVKTAAMGHADNDFFGAVRATALDNFVQQRNQTLSALKAKAFSTRVFGAQILFQTFSSS